MELNKDSTEAYKQLQAMEKCENLIENRRKYLLNIKPTAPKINAYIKTQRKRTNQTGNRQHAGTIIQNSKVPKQ